MRSACFLPRFEGWASVRISSFTSILLSIRHGARCSTHSRLGSSTEVWVDQDSRIDCKMGIPHLYVLWMVIISGNVRAGVELLQRHVGESAVLRCSGPPGTEDTSVYGVRLKRCWLREEQVLFMHKDSVKPYVPNHLDDKRFNVGGDPSGRQVNVTISDLRPGDTDRYCCEFVIEATPDDRIIPGEVEFFIYVGNDDPRSLDVVHMETSAGGSAVLPCTRPLGEGRQAAVEGYSLNRQRSSGPVELLHHSRDQRLPSPSSMLPSSRSSSPFPADRLVFATTPTMGGMVFNLTLLNLQPQESGFYSCSLLLASRPLAGHSLRSPVVYVSVQGGQCNCSSYSTLLYALFAGVAVLLLLLMLLIYWARGRIRVKPQAQVPIYEEMVGVRSPKPKLGPCGIGTFHLEEADVSDYSNSLVAKPRTENHYESPSLARIIQG
ncbi:cd7 antigen-like isoform X2 [Gadus morhua]|uniref:cd7 antigen-like isoform X2 n=1 Tax=Gadus morhua TaxID=8049 RepID=UPI0011B40075|nr:uncharacterized protein LOC115541024 isoform X2 [Gadus morhua]